MLQGKKIIFFDMDGTLIDSVGIWNDVDRALLTQLGTNPEHIDVQAQRDAMLRELNEAENPYVAYCGRLGQKYSSDLSPEEIFHIRYQIAQHYLIHVIDYKPGAEKVLKEMKDQGYLLILATTTRRKNMEIYCTQNKNITAKASPLDYFTHIYTREDVKKIKPDPEIYLRIMEKQKVSPEECLIFEDSLIGVEAANNAGIEAAVIYDRYSDGQREEINARATYTFSNFTEVLAAIQKDE